MNKIYWLLNGSKNIASSRIHGYNIHSKLLSIGQKSTIVYVGRGNKKLNINLFTWLKLRLQLKKGDTLVLQKIKKEFSAFQISNILKLRCKGVKIVLIDCDVPINNDILYLFDMIVVPTQTLAEHVKYDIPCMVIADSPELYSRKIYNRNKKNIFWFGIYTEERQKEINFIRELLHNYNLENKYNFYTLSNDSTSDYIWDDNSLKLLSEQADIIIIPKTNTTERENIKSSNRVLQAMALSKIIITGHYEEYNKVIRTGMNGFICKNEADYYNALCQVEEDIEYKRIVDAAYQTACEYSLDDLIKQWMMALFVQNESK